MALAGYQTWLSYTPNGLPAGVNRAYAIQAAMYFGANDTGLVTCFAFGRRGAGPGSSVSVGGAQGTWGPQPRRVVATTNHF
jgi:hypothetical protein